MSAEESLLVEEEAEEIEDENVFLPDQTYEAPDVWDGTEEETLTAVQSFLTNVPMNEFDLRSSNDAYGQCCFPLQHLE